MGENDTVGDGGVENTTGAGDDDGATGARNDTAASDGDEEDNTTEVTEIRDFEFLTVEDARDGERSDGGTVGLLSPVSNPQAASD